LAPEAERETITELELHAEGNPGLESQK